MGKTLVKMKELTKLAIPIALKRYLSLVFLLKFDIDNGSMTKPRLIVHYMNDIIYIAGQRIPR